MWIVLTGVIRMKTTDKSLLECYNEVKQMEKDLNIKFIADEFDKMMLMLYDPSFTVEVD